MEKHVAEECVFRDVAEENGIEPPYCNRCKDTAEVIGGLFTAVLVNEALHGETCGHEGKDPMTVLTGPQLRQPFTYDEANQMMYRCRDLAAWWKRHDRYFYRLYKTLEDGFRTLSTQIEAEWRGSKNEQHELEA